MSRADVLVTVEGGVADVSVRTPNIIVEIRDYDVDGVESDHEPYWTDENGDCCVRYLVMFEPAAPADAPPPAEPSAPAEPPSPSALGG